MATWIQSAFTATGGGSGTVTTVSVVTANGFAGTVATPTSTPAITAQTTVTGLLKGNGTAVSAAAAGTDYLTPTVTIGQGGTGQVTQQAALDAVAGATTNNQVLAGNGTHVTLRALAAADLPAGTTSAQGALQLEGTASNIAADGTQAAGASAKASAANHVHPADAWVVGDAGLLAMNMDPMIAANTGLMIAGTVYLMRVNIRAAITATNIIVGLTTSGSGASTGTFVGVYNSSGTLLSGSSDQATPLTAAAGTKTMALTTPQALSAGTFVWAAIVSNLATTQPTLGRAAPNVVLANMNLANASFRSAVNGTGQTSLPGSITPSANTGAGSFAFWVGIS